MPEVPYLNDYVYDQLGTQNTKTACPFQSKVESYARSMRAFGSTSLDKYHTEPRHREVRCQVPVLVIVSHSKLYARCQFSAGWTGCRPFIVFHILSNLNCIDMNDYYCNGYFVVIVLIVGGRRDRQEYEAESGIVSRVGMCSDHYPDYF